MDEIKISVLKEHLPYELDMLDEAVEYLRSAEALASNRADWFRRSAAIEAFWTHARNLVEFLNRSKNRDLTVSSASARDFADSFHPKLGKDALTKINEQISHLGFCRKSS